MLIQPPYLTLFVFPLRNLDMSLPHLMVTSYGVMDTNLEEIFLKVTEAALNEEEGKGGEVPPSLNCVPSVNFVSQDKKIILFRRDLCWFSQNKIQSPTNLIFKLVSKHLLMYLCHSVLLSPNSQ